MAKKFLHELPESRILIEQLVRSRGIREQLIEKDYWIMHALWGLKQQEFVFELKGGTSLSKGFEVIDRFSEDLDIRIEPPSELDVKIGKNQDKPSQKESRLRFYDWLKDNISIAGVSTERDTAFDDANARNAGIRLNYKSQYPLIEGIKRYVLLEVGFDTTTPNEPRTIGSWLYDAAISAGLDVIDNRAQPVFCYLPGYTFVEKLNAILRKFQQEQVGKIMPVNFIRHYYDVYRLLGVQEVIDFIGSDAYLKHKQVKFKQEVDFTKNEAFILSSKEIREKYSEQYVKSKVLYYAHSPSFDEIMERIQLHLEKL